MSPTVRGLAPGWLLVLLAAGVHAQESLALVGGRVIDPASGLDRVATVLVRGDRVVSIGTDEVEADRTLDCTGLVVAPGFVDVLASAVPEHGPQRLKIQDGVTTQLGMHGGSVDPVRAGAAFERAGLLLNVGSAVGHASLRLAVGATDPYAAVTAEQLARMEALAAGAIEAGALGIGFGINYTPGARRDEVVALFQVAADHDVPCHVHSRYKGSVFPETILVAVEEVIAAAAITGASAQVVHLASSAVGSMAPALRMIEGARAHGVDVAVDVYPYTANMTSLSSPLYDPGWRERFGGIDFGDVMVVETGERLTEATFPAWRERGASVITFFIPDEELELALRHPLVMVASDGIVRGGTGHPRGAGTFARFLGRYVREQGLLELPEALAKITSMPAARLARSSPDMRDRGRLAPGAFADVTVFDPERILDRATYREPALASEGIVHVLVNGVPVVEDGVLREGVTPGRLVRHAPQPDEGR